MTAYIIASYNGLTPAQAERLDFLQEECAEVIKEIAKIKRHGYDSVNPDDIESGNTRTRLGYEISHMLAALDLLLHFEDVDKEQIDSLVSLRKKDIASGNCYLHHQ
jgi:hypothetical protein